MQAAGQEEGRGPGGWGTMGSRRGPQRTLEAFWSLNLMVFMAAAESQVLCSDTAASRSRFAAA